MVIFQGYDQGFIMMNQGYDHGFIMMNQGYDHGFIMMNQGYDHGFIVMNQGYDHGFIVMNQGYDHGFIVMNQGYDHEEWLSASTLITYKSDMLRQPCANTCHHYFHIRNHGDEAIAVEVKYFVATNFHHLFPR